MSSTIEQIAKDYERGLQFQVQGDLQNAKACFLAVLQENPDHSDALHCLGSIDLKQGRFEAAEFLVRKAISANPMHAGYYGTLASILTGQRKIAEAIKVYHEGLRLNADLPVLHDGLGLLHCESGNLQAAAECFLKALEIDPNNAGVYNNLGRTLNNMGKISEAADVFRRAVKLQPHFADAHNNLGHVLRAQGKLEKARACFDRAVELDPGFAAAHHNRGTIHMSVGEVEEAIKCFERSVELDAKNVLAHINLGVSYHTAGRLKKAAAAYQRAIQLEPDNANAHFGLAIVRNEQRRIDEAERSVRRALEIDPVFVDAYAELAAILEETNQLENLEDTVKRGLKIDPDHPRMNLEAAKCERRLGQLEDAVQRLERFDLSTLTDRLAQHFNYELGLLYDRLDQVDRAFRYFEQANEYGRRSERLRTLSPERYLEKIDRLRDFFSSADVESWELPEALSEKETPVFMYGFPRSGTTLTDVVLDGHPRIRTLEEKPTLSVVEAALMESRQGYPEAMADLTKGEIEALRDLYFQEVDKFVERDPDKLIVDKLPIRTVHAGLIWRLFPNAKIIFSLRHPCDVCLSGFMQQYHPSSAAFANFFTMDDSIRIYDKVMSLWQTYRARLPLKVHVVKYENLIEDVEGETRELLDFLGVEWDPAVLNYEKRVQQRRRIFTNSYHQVAQPIYKKSKYRWRRYRKHLQPYLPILSAHIGYFGYGED